MNLKELLEIARTELSELTTVESPDFRLEQAEYKTDEGAWEVVVSYLVENTNKPNTVLAPLASQLPFQRIYKKIKINNEKEVLGLYIFNHQQ